MTEEKTLLNATVLWLIKDGKVWLAEKASKIGKGRLNGYGGGIEVGETQEVSACREIFEETNGQVIVHSNDLMKVAEVDFHNTKTNNEVFICKVHFFVASKWNGEPVTSVEMLNPKQFEISNLPYDKMMPSDKYWVPKVLVEGKKIKAKLMLGPFQRELLGDVEIEEVESFE